MNKSAKLSWELLAVIILSMVVLVSMLIFSTFIREKIIEAFKVFVENVFGD